MAELIPITSFDTPEQAHIAVGQLEAEGIEACLRNEYVVGANWLWTNAVGGVEVQVKEEDAVRARELLVGPVEDEEEVVFSDYRCPGCGSTKVEFRRCSLPAFLLSMLFLGFPLPFIRPRLRCLDCFKVWKRPRQAGGEQDVTRVENDKQEIGS